MKKLSNTVAEVKAEASNFFWKREFDTDDFLWILKNTFFIENFRMVTYMIFCKIIYLSFLR